MQEDNLDTPSSTPAPDVCACPDVPTGTGDASDTPENPDTSSDASSKSPEDSSSSTPPSPDKDSQSPEAQDSQWEQWIAMAEQAGQGVEAIKQPIAKAAAEQNLKIAQLDRTKAIQTLWDAMSQEAQDAVLNSADTEMLKRIAFPTIYGMSHAWTMAKTAYNALAGNNPEQEQDLLADELRIYVMLGILKPKNPSSAACMDADLEKAGKIAKVGQVLATLATSVGVPPVVGKTLGYVSKVCNVSNKVAKELLPAIREETYRAMESTEVTETANAEHAQIGEQVGNSVIKG